MTRGIFNLECPNVEFRIKVVFNYCVSEKI